MKALGGSSYFVNLRRKFIKRDLLRGWWPGNFPKFLEQLFLNNNLVDGSFWKKNIPFTPLNSELTMETSLWTYRLFWILHHYCNNKNLLYSLHESKTQTYYGSYHRFMLFITSYPLSKFNAFSKLFNVLHSPSMTIC